MLKLNRSSNWAECKTYQEARAYAVGLGIKVQRIVVR